MTIASTLSAQRFPCNGTSTQFPFPNKIFAASDLVVTLIDTLGNLYSFTNFANAATGLSYSVQGVDADTGCTVVFSSPPTNLWTLDVRTQTPEIQSTSIKNQGSFLPELHEEAFDRVTREIQDLMRLTYTYGIHGPDIENTPWPALPNGATRKNTALLFDVNGLPTVGVLITQALTQSLIGQFLTPQTTAEANAGINPPNLFYPFGNLLRYGLVPNNSTPSVAASNLSILKALFNPAFANGPTGNFTFPNTTGVDTYYIGVTGSTCVIPMRNGCNIDAQGCTLNFTGTGTSADSNSGMFMWLSNCSLINFIMVVNWATGVSTSSGNAVQIGARGTDSSYFGGVSSPYPTGVWDSLLATRQGNSTVKGKITSNITGPNLASAAAVALIGGIQGLEVDVYINGGGTLPQGVTYEFGWATNDAQPSARQTSHMHDFRIRVDAQNMDNTGGLSSACILTGAYNGIVENVYSANCSNAVYIYPGEAMFYRPWVGVDDVGAKRNINLKNITAVNPFNAGLWLSGFVPRAAGTGYLQRAWVANTAYGIRETVVNGGNMYEVTAGGTSANTGGPTGTGTPTEGTVTWRYVSLRANTDLMDFSVDGIAVTGQLASTYGVFAAGGHVKLDNGTLTNCFRGVVVSDECTRFDMNEVDCFNNSHEGVYYGDGIAAWSPARPKKGHIKLGYVAGNSQASAGTYNGIQVNGAVDSLLIQSVRLGYEAAYSFVAETTQAAGVACTSSATQQNVVCDKCHVSASSVGGVAYLNATAISLTAGGVSAGCTVQGATGLLTQAGAWLNSLQGPSNDRGDNSITLTVGTDYTTQRFDTNITATRTVTLSTTGAVQGSKFRIERGAPGAFNLAVGSGPLKNLAAGTWGDFEYSANQAAWMETASGSL